jgi:uncharacterized protein
MRVAVLSDTHAPTRWKTCPPEVAAHLETVDAILHAGDVCTPAVLDELEAWAPVHAVRGNNDGKDIAAWGAPHILHIDLAGVATAMIHDSGPTEGRARRLRTQFPDAALVVFGHSHIPLNEVNDGQRIFNPGSPTDRRRQPQGTMGLLDIDGGRVTSARIVTVT